MVIPAPPVHNVLAAFLEFAGDAVLVGHNVRFDLSFLQAAAVSGGYPPLTNRVVDTCALARRLVRDEVPNCRLSTLAERLRLAHRPSHRALADALATVDLLHTLLERAGNLGVLGLDDLLELPTIRAHPQVGKLRLTASLPRRPGVYLFRGLGGRVLYVGKATELRSRVRSYFSGDERRKVSQLLRETVTIDHVVCPGPLEAGVLEVRLIHRHLPPFNHRSKLWRRYAYLKLTLDERFPRLSVVRTTRDDGCLYLGPLSSSAAARQVADAIESAVPIRRCTGRPGRVPREWPCSPAQLGAATCPCAGTVSEADYAILVGRVVAGLTGDPAVLLNPLRQRMTALAEAERFEDAAVTRDRANALARALHRQRRLDRLRRAGRVELELTSDGQSPCAPRRLVLDCGRLVDASDAGTLDLWPERSPERDTETSDTGTGPQPGGPVSEPQRSEGERRRVPLPRHLVDELAWVASWLEAEAHRVRLVHCEGELASCLPPIPLFTPPKQEHQRTSDRRSGRSARRAPRL